MLTLNDGRAELWQWDTGRTLSVDADCSQVHFSNKVFGRSIDVDVTDGVAIIPDILLQTDKDLNVWAFVGTAENGYTKISKTFKVNRRNKPADYVFTPVEQTTLAELSGRLDRIEESQDQDAIKNAVEAYLEQNPVEAPVQSVNGKTGEVELTAKDVGAISQDDLQETTNEVLAQAKASGEFDGADGAPGKDGADGQDGAPGADGNDGITPTIGDNGNWYLGETDTGKPSRGETGPAGADGKSAYAYAVDGEYTGTETAFAEKLAQEQLVGTTDELTPAQVYQAVSAGIPVKVQYFDEPFGLLSYTNFNAAENIGTIAANTIVYYNGVYMLSELIGNADVNEWLFFSTALAQKTDIPSVLPNPNALTFTGAVTGSYDGSEPLTVNIPSSAGGSGGSGGLPNWRLIKTLAFSSEIASITFSEDDNGDAFAVKELMIVGTAPALASNGYLFCRPSSSGQVGNNSLWPTAGKAMRWWLASVDGALKTMLAVSNTDVIWPMDKNISCPSDIVQICIGASAGFTADGTLYVYGR